MSDETPIPEPAAVIRACFHDLAANCMPETILRRLRGIESSVTDPALRVRLLHARAIATARLGFSTESLGDLQEAIRILGQTSNNEERAAIFRSIALVHSWRGDCVESALALLRAVAEANAANNLCELGLTLIEAARLHMEMGKPHSAQVFLVSALQSSSPALPVSEWQRAWVNLLQARVASGEIDNARVQFGDLSTVLQNSSNRLRVLALIELARISKLCKELENAEAILEQAQALVSKEMESFEEIEIAHARAEILLCKGRLNDAESLINKVVSRYAIDDLAGREIVARFLQAQILDQLGKSDHAEQTLAAALRRGLARGLSGYVDEARSRIASRGASQGTWRVGEVPNAVRPFDIHSRFVRRREVGAGGFGTIAKAYDLELGVEVALKRTRLSDVYDNSARLRLLHASQTEVAAASRVEHPGVARVLGLLTELHGDAYLIQEFIEGPTLRMAMAAPIEQPRAFEILSRIAFALAAIHAAGVIHRDIKPENIVLRSGDAPVLVDFGIAQIAGEKQMSLKSGTLSYMSPEQLSGGRIDERSDLYSLGLIACELLIRTRPNGCFGADVADRLSRRGGVEHALIEDGIPAMSAKLIAKLVSKSRLWRPRSATVVAKVFAEASRYVSPKA